MTQVFKVGDKVVPKWEVKKREDGDREYTTFQPFEVIELRQTHAFVRDEYGNGTWMALTNLRHAP